MRQFAQAGAVITAIFASTCGFVAAAHAMPLGSPATDGLSVVEQVAICFYIDGWNGPGMYQCGYRHRHGNGWVGMREERREIRGERREYRGERREERGERWNERSEWRGERR
jgi:hypothetical protein